MASSRAHTADAVCHVPGKLNPEPKTAAQSPSEFLLRGIGRPGALDISRSGKIITNATIRQPPFHDHKRSVQSGRSVLDGRLWQSAHSGVRGFNPTRAPSFILEAGVPIVIPYGDNSLTIPPFVSLDRIAASKEADGRMTQNIADQNSSQKPPSPRRAFGNQRRQFEL